MGYLLPCMYCWLWLGHLHFSNGFGVRRVFFLADRSVGKELDDVISSYFLHWLRLWWWVLNITDMNVIFTHLMMFFFIFPPGLNRLLNLLNPLSGRILMIAGISHFIFSLVNYDKTKPLFSSQPRFVFMIKNLDSLDLFKTDMHTYLV